MGFFDRLTSPRGEPASPDPLAEAPPDATFTTKAFRKLLAALAAREAPVLIDLGPVVGGNVGFFGEQLGCKIFVEDLYTDLDRHVREDRAGELPAFFTRRFARPAASVDAILCWDLVDYLERPAAEALAAQLIRQLRPGGVLLAFFGTGQPSEGLGFHKFVIVDEHTLRARAYPSALGRRPSLPNRDILRLFPSLGVSDSYLLHNNLREVMFKKPV